MNNYVHYLVRQPRATDQLISPSQIEERDYFTVGCFYIIGRPGEALLDSYRFHAMLRKDIIIVDLKRYKNSKSFYRTNVEGIGNFIFGLEAIGHELRYAGMEPTLNGLQAVRRLRPKGNSSLELACKKHDFYFLGYSEAIDK